VDNITIKSLYLFGQLSRSSGSNPTETQAGGEAMPQSNDLTSPQIASSLSPQALRTRISLPGEAYVHSVSLVLKLVFKVLPGTQIISDDVRTHFVSLMGPSLLIETEMDAAVDAGIIDVVRDFFPITVIEGDAWQTWMRQRDGVAALAESLLKHLASGTGHGRMARQITGVRRRRDQRNPGRIGIGQAVAIDIAIAYRGLRSPKIVVVLRVPPGNGGITHAHRQ
jgi:hypothetical protein